MQWCAAVHLAEALDLMYAGPTAHLVDSLSTQQKPPRGNRRSHSQATSAKAQSTTAAAGSGDEVSRPIFADPGAPDDALPPASASAASAAGVGAADHDGATSSNGGRNSSSSSSRDVLRRVPEAVRELDALLASVNAPSATTLPVPLGVGLAKSRQVHSPARGKHSSGTGSAQEEDAQPSSSSGQQPGKRQAASPDASARSELSGLGVCPSFRADADPADDNTARAAPARPTAATQQESLSLYAQAMM